MRGCGAHKLPDEEQEPLPALLVEPDLSAGQGGEEGRGGEVRHLGRTLAEGLHGQPHHQRGRRGLRVGQESEGALCGKRQRGGPSRERRGEPRQEKGGGERLRRVSEVGAVGAVVRVRGILCLCHLQGHGAHGVGAAEDLEGREDGAADPGGAGEAGQGCVGPRRRGRGATAARQAARRRLPDRKHKGDKGG